MSETASRRWRGGAISQGRTEEAPAVRIVTSDRAPVDCTVSTTLPRGRHRASQLSLSLRLSHR